MLGYFCFVLFYSVNWLLVRSISSPPSFLSPKDKNVLLTFYVALTHSILTLAMSSFSHYSTSGVSYTSEDTELQHMIIKNTLGYLTYDLILGFIQHALDIKMVLHHFFGIVGGLAILQDSKVGSAAMVALLLTEITSPMFQVKSILKLIKKDDSLAAQVNEALFAVTFIITRPVLVWVLLYNMICAGYHWVIIANSSIIYAVGLVWSYTILCIIRLKIMKVKPGTFEKVRDYKLFSGAVLAWATLVLPNIVGSERNWAFIHLRYGNFTFI